MTGKSLLIVEDDPGYQELYRFALSKHELTLCASAEEAAAWVGRRPFDLIISDLNLLGSTGLEFLDEMRRRGVAARVPIILCTSMDDPALRQCAMERGAAGFLVKPFSNDALWSLAAAYLAYGRAKA